MVSRSRIALVAALAVAFVPFAADAHAFLDKADPRVGSVVAHAPPAIRLRFTQGVVVPFCRVSVTGPPGFGGAGPPHAVAGDPLGLAVDLKGPSPPGAYVVRWRALSVDTHVTEGDFSFQVKPQVTQ